MIMQLIVVALVAFIAYWWASQGALSALLHLACVVAAGAIAFGVWELVTIKGLMPLHEFFHTTGWAIGLLVPFVLLLTIFRVACDKLVAANIAIQPNLNWVLGAVFGLGAGVLTVGIALIGVGHLQIPPTLFGYQPYAHEAPGPSGGTIARQQSLWIPVDTITQGFYEMLSGGAFASSQPLREYRPQVAAQATLLRINHDDGKSRNSMQPGDAIISRVMRVQGAPQDIYDYGEQRGWTYSDPFNDRITSGTGYIVVVDFTASARERGGTMAVGNAQFQLVGRNERGEVTTVFPIAVISQSNAPGNPLGRFRFDSPIFISSLPGESRPTMAFEFVLPEGYEPAYFMARGLRLELPAEQPATMDVATRNRALATGTIVRAGGQRYVEQADFNTQLAQRIAAGARDSAIRVDSRLPNRWAVLRDRLSGLRANDDRQIEGGRQTIRVEVLEERVPIALAVNSFASSRGESIVMVDTTAMQTLRVPPARPNVTQTPLLVDAEGNQFVAIGYIFVERGQAEIRFDSGDPILRLGQLPASLSPQRDDQQLYLLFSVRTGVTLQRFTYGPEVRAEFQMRVN